MTRRRRRDVLFFVHVLLAVGLTLLAGGGILFVFGPPERTRQAANVLGAVGIASVLVAMLIVAWGAVLEDE